MTRELLVKDDMNVFSITYVNSLLYWQAAINIRVVALEVVYLLKTLQECCELDLASVHLIGHSLGAHAAGYIGEYLKGIGRITGLDPAQPMFQSMPAFVRLDPTDALFVDVIHTDISDNKGFGMKQSCGHLDFYPNSGNQQPGCSILSSPQLMLKEGVMTTAKEMYFCAHVRAHKLFTESIHSSCPFLAYECNTFEAFVQGQCTDCGIDNEKCAEMGYHADRYIPRNRANIRMFLVTAKTQPYCLYTYAVTLELPNVTQTQEMPSGQLWLTLTGNQGVIKKLPLTGSPRWLKVPYLGIRIPMQKRVKTREFPAGTNMTLMGSSNMNVGDVRSAIVHWEYSPSNFLMKKRHCFFRCSHPLYVSKVIVHHLSTWDGRFKSAVLCQQNGKDYEIVETEKSAKFVTVTCFTSS